GGVHHHVGAVLDRPDQVGRADRVVHDQRHTDLVRDGGDRLDVQDVALGVGDRLAVEELRVLLRGGSPGGRVVRVVHEGDRQAQLRQGVVQQVVGAPVQGGAGHEVVTRLGDVQDRDELGGLPGGHHQ